MKALFYDAPSGDWLLFENPIRMARAYGIDRVAAVVADIEDALVSQGLYAAGYVSYEAAPAFDPAFRVKPTGTASPPLARFGLFREPLRLRELPTGEGEPTCRVSAFSPTLRKADYLSAFTAVKERLAAGDAYQVNLTYRLEARYAGDPYRWFAERARSRPGNYMAYMEFGDLVICSLSPELFFGRAFGDGLASLVMRPMKGTRMAVPGRNAEIAADLRADGKCRAENLMIVDMIRNDAGRVALPGSVRVPALYEIETYPTVLQMTSTVTAETRASLAETISALFPCASITGAPKVRSMEIIEALEADPRGVYTGAIGYAKPSGDALFSVAIRAAEFYPPTRMVRYGTGGGLVWDSRPADEYDETLAKISVLAEADDFYVFESILLESGTYYLLERHLKRLAGTLRFFGFDRLGPERAGYDAESYARDIRKRLERAAGEIGGGRYKAKIEVRPGDGPGKDCVVSLDPVPPIPTPYTVTLAKTRVDPADPFTGHKTSYRHFIDEAIASVTSGPGLGPAPRLRPADVILVNRRDEITETSRGNVVLSLGGTLFTPFRDAGILPGTMRAELIEAGKITERRITIAEYREAEAVFMVNSVRGMVPCKRLDT